MAPVTGPDWAWRTDGQVVPLCDPASVPLQAGRGLSEAAVAVAVHHTGQLPDSPQLAVGGPAGHQGQ